LIFDGEITPGQDLLSSVGKYEVSEPDRKTFTSLKENSEVKAEEESEEEDQNTQSEAAAEPQQEPVEQTLVDDKKGDSFKEFDRSSIQEKVGVDDPGKFTEESSASAASSGLNNVLPDSEIALRVLGFVEQSVSALPDGRTLIVGATAVSPADTNESYAVQSAIESIASRLCAKWNQFEADRNHP